jgi:hypothetical protein|tara:strand:+ start:331 stop:633 length:303 start_codon:yes stop_codon:yes gene_type:complete
MKKFNIKEWQDKNLNEGYYKSGKKDDITAQKYTDEDKELGWPLPINFFEYDLKSLKTRWDGWIKGPVSFENNEAWSSSEKKAAQKLLKTTIDKWFKKNIK